MINADSTKLVQELDELREVRHPLRLTRLPELERGVQESASDCKGGKSLKRYLQNLEVVAVHRPARVRGHKLNDEDARLGHV